MRNLVEEFRRDHGIRPPTILGVREHVFTGRSGMSFLLIVAAVIWLFCLISYQLCFGHINAVSHLWPGSCPIKRRAS